MPGPGSGPVVEKHWRIRYVGRTEVNTQHGNTWNGEWPVFFEDCLIMRGLRHGAFYCVNDVLPVHSLKACRGVGI